MNKIIDKTMYKELKNYSGSKNYEVSVLFDENFEILDNVLINNHNGNLSISVYKKQKLRKIDTYQTMRVNKIGEKIDVMSNSYSSLSDGTIWGGSFYCNFNINGDSTRHKFLDPFSNKIIEDNYEFESKEKDPDKWMAKFKEYYNNASYVKISRNNSNTYYLKVKDKWYFMENTLEGTPENFKKLYPAKEDQDIRMIPLTDLAPEYYHPQQGAEDNGLIKLKEYESTFFEKEEQGLNSYSYSAGWWYLEIYMPLGDTLRIKRYSNYEDPEIQLYKVPSAYGGRDDVLFIVQKPEEMFPEQVGGMYVIRPRDMKQPERRYKSISYGKRDNGEEYIINSEESDAYRKWTSSIEVTR